MKISKEKLRSYIKKIGIAGLIFFTIKGLIWLLILLFLGSRF